MQQLTQMAAVRVSLERLPSVQPEQRLHQANLLEMTHPTQAEHLIRGPKSDPRMLRRNRRLHREAARTKPIIKGIFEGFLISSSMSTAASVIWVLLKNDRKQNCHISTNRLLRLFSHCCLKVEQNARQDGDKRAADTECLDGPGYQAPDHCRRGDSCNVPSNTCDVTNRNGPYNDPALCRLGEWGRR